MRHREQDHFARDVAPADHHESDGNQEDDHQPAHEIIGQEQRFEQLIPVNHRRFPLTDRVRAAISSASTGSHRSALTILANSHTAGSPPPRSMR